jgi:PEP-CTERM motif
MEADDWQTAVGQHERPYQPTLELSLMSRTFLAAALAALGLMAHSQAHAAPVYAGHLGEDPKGPFIAPHGGNHFENETLDMVYLFTLSGTHNAHSFGQVEDPGAGFEATASMLTLWRSNGDDDYSNDALLGGFDFDVQPVEMGFEGLTSGEYFWRLETTLNGGGGWVTFGAEVTPVSAVPEPTSQGLLLAGLMGMGLAARRRSRR